MGQCPCLSLATSSSCPQTSCGCLRHNQHRPKGCCMGWGFPSVAGEHRKDSPGIVLYHVPQQVTSPQASLSLSLPGAGLVERYNGPQIPRPLPGAREVFEGKVSTERNREGKIWSKEISKESGHRCAPGLLLGRALWSVWLTGQNKPCNRAWAILENTVPADSYGEAALKTLKLPLYSLFSQQKGDLHQSRDKRSMPFEVLYGNKTVGGNPVTSPVTHQHGMLCPQNLLCSPQNTGRGSGSGGEAEASPAGLHPCSPCHQRWHQVSRGEHGQFAV